MENKEIDILDILIIIAKHKKFVIITTLIVSVIAVIYSLLTTQYWTSTATILPAQEQRSQASFISSSLRGFGSSLLGGTLQTQGMDLVTIMKSRTFSEDVVRKFNLIKYLKIDNPDSLISMELAVRALKKKISKIKINEETGVISISIETKDRFLSSKIANYYWQLLDKYNREIRMTKGKQSRIFIEERLYQIKNELDSLAMKINEFQKRNKTIDLNQQTIKLINSYSDLISQKMNIEIEIEYNKEFLDSYSPIIQSLIKKKQIIDKKIKEIELSEDNLKPKYILNIDDIPDLSLKYAYLKLNYQIKQNLYEFLYPQYESAKIEEIKDLPTIEVIDKAIPAGLRSRPKRAKLCIISFMLSLFLSSLYVYTNEMLKTSGRNKKIKQIFDEIRDHNKINE
ncbi:MAG: hypothetical protein DRH57_02570 [Candidatus Cloacimonadota bacterium]|nr:MAG: hypothetical protein DRH57_02570 [Candidatus Cloacimonadota bacterium]